MMRIINAHRQPDILSEARSEAARHRAADPDMVLAKFFPNESEIRLLEVSNAVAEAGEILPFRFGPASRLGVHFYQVIILVAPGEWQDVQDGKLSLPDGWDLKTAIDM